MAKSCLEFEDRKLTVCELLKAKKLPIVVRFCEEENADDTYDYCHPRISGKTKVFLQKALKLKFALVKVLRYHDNAVKEKEHGPEYVLEHDTYIGEKFYIPVKYNGSFKFSHWPGSRRRYATISQVLEELPRYISLGEATEATCSSGQKVTIPAKTKLEVRLKFRDTHDGSILLDCTDGDRSFSFTSKDRLNCYDIEDPKTYHLFEHVRNKMLPKVIIFQNISPNDCILMDLGLKSALLTSVEGPIELIRFEDIEIVVGWVRDKETKTCNTVLIPSGMWNKLLVREKCLHTKENRYKHCGNTRFLETCLYWMYPDKTQITWLMSPEFYKRAVTGIHTLESKTHDFQDSTDEEGSSDYEEIFETPPTLPERSSTIVSSKRHHKQIKRNKSIFHQLHKEMKGIFKNEPPKDFKTDGQAGKIQQHRPSYLSQSSNDGDSNNSDLTNDMTNALAVNISNRISRSESNRHSDSSDNNTYQFGPPSESGSSHHYDYLVTENVTELDFSDSDNYQFGTPSESGSSHHYDYLDMENGSELDFSDTNTYQFCPSSESRSSHFYDYLDIEENVTRPAKQKPLSIPPESQETVPFTETILSITEKPTDVTETNYQNTYL